MDFPKKSSVCFIGDSIVAADKFTRIIIDFFALHFPEKQIQFHNIAIPGSTAAQCLQTLDAFLETYRPTHAIVLFGINDLQRVLFSDSVRESAALFKKREAAIEKYLENMRCLSEKLLEIPHVFLTPSPHEEADFYPPPKYKGFDAHLKKASLALSKAFPNVLDLHSVLSGINDRRIVPSLIGPDRVHPENLCHIIMADRILRYLGFTNPRLPLWDARITENERELLKSFAILESDAPKNPYSDARFEATRKLLSLCFVETVLSGLDKNAETDAFLQAELKKNIEPWRKACYRDYLENHPTKQERQAAARIAMENMYKEL